MKSALQEAAILVRSKLEQAKLDGAFVRTLPWFSSVQYFPIGCCKMTAMVFLYCVKKRLEVNPDLLFLMANAQISPDDSHAWAKVGEFHVDLTGDQFGKEKVIVSDSDPWPDIHAHPAEYPFDDEGYSEHVRIALKMLFDYICDRTQAD